MYFKRSCPVGPERPKQVLPLGLNCQVFSNGVDWKAVRRVIFYSKGLPRWKQLIGHSLGLRAPAAQDEKLRPVLNAAPVVIFMARLWDPDAKEVTTREMAEERRRLNDMRIQCVKILRNELGGQFFGGIVPDDFSSKGAKDVLLEDPRLCRQRRYLSLLSRVSIGVATTGLHGSIGHKFAEYVASGKAIVSEKPNFLVPGQLANGRNYLEFSSPETCAGAAVRLLEDKNMRLNMMMENCHYFNGYLRPDQLVLRTIGKAIAASS